MTLANHLPNLCLTKKALIFTNHLPDQNCWAITNSSYVLIFPYMLGTINNNRMLNNFFIHMCHNNGTWPHDILYFMLQIEIIAQP